MGVGGEQAFAREGRQGRMWEGVGETPPEPPGRAEQSRGTLCGRREEQQQSVSGAGCGRTSQTAQLCREQRP